MSDFHRLQFCDDFGSADPVAPISARAQAAIDGLLRYSRIMEWARKRYTRDGRLVISVGDQPSPYTRLERAAWRKFAA